MAEVTHAQSLVQAYADSSLAVLSVLRSGDRTQVAQQKASFDIKFTELEALMETLGESLSAEASAKSTEGQDKVKSSTFNLITLDLNMPGESGVSWLRKFRASGASTPIVIVSESSPAEAEKVFGALDQGAQEYVVKSKLQEQPEFLLEVVRQLIPSKLNKSNSEFLPLQKFQQTSFAPEVILVGASTRGPAALAELLDRFPQSGPPVVVVQHISPEFARALATRLEAKSGLRLVDARSSQKLQGGQLYVATGDYHLTLQRRGKDLWIELSQTEKLFGHRPSVDVLFKSAAKAKAAAISILLTGMGHDGADGTLELFKKGQSYTMAQDEQSSVVYGMPGRARELGALHFVGNLSELRHKTERLLSSNAEVPRVA